jgi:3-phenylpropionate/trans-cinnamate dioxygenase ferredoxin component
VPVEAVPPGSVLRITVEQTDILICNRGPDGIFAIRNRCSHMNKPLHAGRVIGCKISCPEHGAEFDIRSGEALSFPAVRPIRTYPVEVRGGIIHVYVAREDAPAVRNPWLNPWEGD